MNILILQNTILHYRKALYNKLGEKYNITILHSGQPTKEVNDKYFELITNKTKIGPFFIQNIVINEVNSGKYDIIIAMCDLHWLNNIIALYLHPNTSKFIWWGSWLTKNKFTNYIKINIAKKADANIFYTKDEMEIFEHKGVSLNKLFTANNTFDVGERIKSFNNPIKNKILFVGSFDKRKELNVLIKAFSKIINQIDQSINLVLIGDGDEKENLKSLVKFQNINDRVIFEGRINNPEKLKDFYLESIVSVSFGQAGLSVLQSQGYGVPFITKINAISGGEKTNIINGYNGFFGEDNEKSLAELLTTLCNDIELAKRLGENSYNYYSNFCTIDNMAQGFINAIEYVSKKR